MQGPGAPGNTRKPLSVPLGWSLYQELLLGGRVGQEAHGLVMQGSCLSGPGHSTDKLLDVRNSEEGTETACPGFSVQSRRQGELELKERRTEKELYRQFKDSSRNM